MKLYAITCNSKGKTKDIGDNERLDIELYFKNNKVYSLHLYADENEDGTFSPVITSRDFRGEAKKQKGEKWRDIDIQTGEFIPRHE